MRHFVFCALLTISVQALTQECKQSVPVIVLDEKTHTSVSSLTAEQMELKIGKAKLPLTSVEPIARYRVLLIVDASGSMAGPDSGDPGGSHPEKYLLLISQTLNQLLDNLPPNVQVEVGVFSNKAAFGNRFTSDPKELNESMAQAEKQIGVLRKGKTALYDAIHEGLGRFDSERPGDSILVVTDGGENHSHITEKRLRQELEEKGVRLFSVMIQWKYVSPEESSAASSFRDLVELTGGSVHLVDTAKAFWHDEEAQDLSRYWTEELLSGYVVHFNVPSSFASHQKWQLSANAKAFPKKRIVAIHPQRLRPCSLTTATAR